MGYTISISASPENVWMVQNQLFAEFANVFCRRYINDKEIVRHMSMSMEVNGLSLDELYRQKPEVALKLNDALLTVADEISRGDCSLMSNQCSQRDIQMLFAQLVVLLQRFKSQDH